MHIHHGGHGGGGGWGGWGLPYPVYGGIYPYYPVETVLLDTTEITPKKKEEQKKAETAKQQQASPQSQVTNFVLGAGVGALIGYLATKGQPTNAGWTVGGMLAGGLGLWYINK